MVSIFYKLIAGGGVSEAWAEAVRITKKIGDLKKLGDYDLHDSQKFIIAFSVISGKVWLLGLLAIVARTLFAVAFRSP